MLLDDIAEWSPWLPWTGARAQAPRQPGVYLLRVDGQIVYVGKAGERAGRDGQRAPQGLWGRLGRYASGKAATSGFGEHVLDRALADPAFVRERLQHLETVGPERTVRWALAAIDWVAPHVCWAVTPTGVDALALERRAISALTEAGVVLWNYRS